MTLITRLSRLFRADFHAVLDHIEEPDVLLRQSIREMEEALFEQERAIRAAVRESEDAAARQRRLEERVREIDDELDLCLGSGKDDLARGLIRRKLETRRLLAHLEEKRASLADAVAERETALAGNRAALDGLRQKAELVDIRAAFSAEPGQESRMSRDPVVTDDEVEIAFLREKSARTPS